MKTSSKQSGFIKLASGNASIQAGTLWHAGAYFKADHLYRGLSLLLGFTYASRNNDRVTPQDCCIFDPFIVNTDLMFHGWSSNTLHLGVEYDFARQCHHVAPRIALFYDRIVSGKRVFNTNIIEGKIGIDVVWHFN
jgi:hypothetical protein